MRASLLLAAVLCAAAVPGCSLERAGVAPGDRATDLDAGECVSSGPELCNGRDDDCDGAVDEGFSLDSDVSNCGSCDRRCASGPHGLAACTLGVCTLSCDAGFADCNGVAGDGCEAALSSALTCGSCVTSCGAAAPLCEENAGAYSCTDACSGPTVPCGASCVDVETSTAHCGGCDTPCPSRASASVACARGRCEYACAEGFASCDGLEENGCETSLRSLASCGACGAPCAIPNASASCASGACALVSCAPGFADCDGASANGCETATTTRTDCGGCGALCVIPNASASCTSGACVRVACDPGWGDCDGMAANGCEADLSRAASCGACGVTCAGGDRCGPRGCVRPTAVVEVAAGSDFSCARIADGRVYCWGANGSGQLGNGTTDPSSTAVPVTGLVDAIAIAAGDLHACAIREGGAVVCWGENGRGQVASGGTSDRTTPAAAGDGVTDAVQVAAGGEHTCVVRAGGAVACWGRNNKGQLGTGGGDRASATNVAGITSAVQVTAGFDHTCVARADGSVWCWGENGDRQLGDGTTTDRSAPVQVMTLTEVLGLDAGAAFACALRRGAEVVCWGDNASRQLVDGTTTDRSVPVAIAGLASPNAVTGGGQHACALLGSGAVACWGSNGAGRLGDGTTMARDAPVAVTGLTSATHVAAGGAHACAARADGTAVCWGAGAQGRLGDGDTADRSAPVVVTGLP